MPYCCQVALFNLSRTKNKLYKHAEANPETWHFPTIKNPITFLTQLLIPKHIFRRLCLPARTQVMMSDILPFL
jgi:hypothetical protein